MSCNDLVLISPIKTTKKLIFLSTPLYGPHSAVYSPRPASSSRALKQSMRWERRWETDLAFLPNPILIIRQWMNCTWTQQWTLLITATHTHTHTRTPIYLIYPKSFIKENSSAQLQPVTVWKVTVILCVKWRDGMKHCQNKKWASSSTTLGKLIFCRSNRWKWIECGFFSEPLNI